MDNTCKVIDNKFVFNFDLTDGEYILNWNNEDYFSLFSKEQFETMIEKLNVAAKKENRHSAKTFIRHLYSRAEIVNIEKNCFDILICSIMLSRKTSIYVLMLNNYLKWISFKA